MDIKEKATIIKGNSGQGGNTVGGCRILSSRAGAAISSARVAARLLPIPSPPATSMGRPLHRSISWGLFLSPQIRQESLPIPILSTLSLHAQQHLPCPSLLFNPFPIHLCHCVQAALEVRGAQICLCSTPTVWEARLSQGQHQQWVGSPSPSLLPNWCGNRRIGLGGGTCPLPSLPLSHSPCCQEGVGQEQLWNSPCPMVSCVQQGQWQWCAGDGVNRSGEYVPLNMKLNEQKGILI